MVHHHDDYEGCLQSVAGSTGDDHLRSAQMCDLNDKMAANK